MWMVRTIHTPSVPDLRLRFSASPSSFIPSANSDGAMPAVRGGGGRKG